SSAACALQGSGRLSPHRRAAPAKKDRQDRAQPCQASEEYEDQAIAKASSRFSPSPEICATTSLDSPRDSYHPAVTKMVSGRLRIVHSDLLHCHQIVVRILERCGTFAAFRVPTPERAYKPECEGAIQTQVLQYKPKYRDCGAAPMKHSAKHLDLQGSPT